MVDDPTDFVNMTLAISVTLYLHLYLKTALMQACRYGHWEVVQTLLLFRCNVSLVYIFIF
jgi:hypothetical protein